METLVTLDTVIDKVNDVENQKQPQQYILGYWNIRGLADWLRLMLEYGNIKYENKRYPDMDAYSKDKFSLNLHFPNLPYLIDNKTGLKLTESTAIGKYLANKLSLADTGSYKEAMIEGIVNDLMTQFVRLCYNPDFKTLRNEFNKNIRDNKSKLNYIEQYLSNSKEFNKNNKNKQKKYLICDNRLSFADFKFFSYLDFLNRFDSNILENYPVIKQYYANFCKLDCVKSFQENRDLNIWSGGAQWKGESLNNSEMKEEIKEDIADNRVGAAIASDINDDMFTTAINAVKNDIENRADNNNIKRNKFKVVSMMKQVVAGMTYFAKVEINDGEYCFVKIWAKLDRTYELTEVQFGKKSQDVLKYF